MNRDFIVGRIHVAVEGVTLMLLISKKKDFIESDH
jgi:hypothetical protein